jgi:hypothetical protein
MGRMKCSDQTDLGYETGRQALPQCAENQMELFWEALILVDLR